MNFITKGQNADDGTKLDQETQPGAGGTRLHAPNGADTTGEL